MSTPPTSWWQRNWQWFLPTSVVIGIALANLLFHLVGGFMNDSGATRKGLAMARANPAAVAAFGEPIEQIGMITGSLSMNGPNGDAALAIPLRGPRGEGTLYVEAEMHADRWTFQLAEIELDGGEDRIDLLATE